MKLTPQQLLTVSRRTGKSASDLGRALIQQQLQHQLNNEYGQIMKQKIYFKKK